LRPQFDSPLFSRLSLSVDYYKIKLTDAIGTMSANVILPRCYNLDGASNPTYDPNNFYCALTHRSPSTHVFEYLLAPTINLAAYRTWGVDVQLDWSFALDSVGLPSKWGSLQLNSVVSYTGEYAIQNSAQEPLLDFGGTIGNNQVDEAIAHPTWKAITSLSHTVGKFRTTLRWRYIGPMNDAISVTRPTADTAGVSSVNYFDLIASVGIGDKFELRGGILNLTDKFPPVWTEKGDTDPFAYDLIGRRFYFGARVTF
jgi:outer membrane receptor protein involved in Fe transport